MKILPDNILRRMRPKDRPQGNAGRTADECRERWRSGEEKKLQAVIANFLTLKGIYFEWDRMDKRTSGKKGRPDFRLCYRGRFIAVECKASGGILSREQAITMSEIRNNGGVAVVAYGLPDVLLALNDKLRDGATERRPSPPET